MTKGSASGSGDAVTLPMLQILLSLADGERHGYGILLEMERRIGGVRLGTGTLYTAIKRLLMKGLIEESEDRPDASEDDARRRYYRLTDLGRETARREARKLERVVMIAREKDLLTETTKS